MSRAIAVVAANPDILPLEFLLGIMRDRAVAPDIRIKVAQAAAPYCHPKPTDVPTDPADSAKIIGAISEADRARIEDHFERLRQLELKNLLIPIPLNCDSLRIPNSA
jgi:hypothetical protein